MENKDTITAGTDKRYCVYLYTFPDGMFYYGKSSVEGLAVRHSNHANGCYDIGVWIRRWRLKGVDVKPEPVEFFGSESDALAREKDLIEETDAVNKGLNMCEGGGQPPSRLGKRHTDEARAKVSMNNPMKRPDVRAKVAVTKSTPEYRAKLSAAVKKAMNRPEVRAKMSANNPMKRPEVVEKLKRAGGCRPPVLRGDKHHMKRPEVRAKLSANNPMRCPKARAKVSAARKRYWAERRAAEIVV